MKSLSYAQRRARRAALVRLMLSASELLAMLAFLAAIFIIAGAISGSL